MRITRLGAGGEVLSSIETSEHTVYVAPGQYEVAAVGLNGGGALGSAKVTVSTGQELEVQINSNPIGGPGFPGSFGVGLGDVLAPAATGHRANEPRHRQAALLPPESLDEAVNFPASINRCREGF